ncbi:MAG TPA: ATP-binding protein [Chryseolinea sp.]|nr:ATP-binding protein [Chryseolinea sp.]
MEYPKPKPIPRRLHINSKASTTLLIIAIILVLATLATTSYRNLINRRSVGWISHTHEIIEASRALLSSVGDAEAIHRDLILAVDTSGLTQRFTSAFIRVDTLPEIIRQMTIDNRSQTNLLDKKIIPLTTVQLQRWLENLKYTSTGIEKYVSTLSDRNRNALLDSIYHFTSTFIDNEERLLVKRNATLVSDYLITDIIRFTFLLGIATICLGAFFTIRNQLRENKNLVADLEKMNASLELRVEQRTQELKESLDEIQFLYDHAPCGHHTIAPNGLIVKMNKTELEWLGYSEEEVVDKKYAGDFLTKASREAREQALETLKKIGHMENLEFEFVRRDGSIFPVLINTIAYFDSNGNFLLNRSTVYDISLRKQLEQKLKEANAYLTHLNKEKNRFLGIAAHDLKNPVNAISSLAHLLKRSSDLKEGDLEYLNLIELTAAKMKMLIEKLLDLNRIEQSGPLVQAQMVNVDAFLNNVVKTFSEISKKKNIPIIVENNVGDFEFLSDQSLLEQVLDNLVSNAIKFSPPNRTVWLRTKRNEKQLIFDVEDQGPGISPEELPKLFGTFQRLSTKPTGGEESTGLGLSIVKAIVQVLDGEVTVVSELGQGTIFTVVLNLKN